VNTQINYQVRKAAIFKAQNEAKIQSKQNLWRMNTILLTGKPSPLTIAAQRFGGGGTERQAAWCVAS